MGDIYSVRKWLAQATTEVQSFTHYSLVKPSDLRAERKEQQAASVSTLYRYSHQLSSNRLTFSSFIIDSNACTEFLYTLAPPLKLEPPLPPDFNATELGVNEVEG